jgi:hypothetical protein
MKTKEVRADRQQNVREQGKQDVRYWIDPLIYPATIGRYA